MLEATCAEVLLNTVLLEIYRFQADIDATIRSLLLVVHSELAIQLSRLKRLRYSAGEIPTWR
ncbi:MAG: hypothetical protein JWP89_627 [Schlesneria sp.]|nr:hypothetical protein [Schlesneria sp.]